MKTSLACLCLCIAALIFGKRQSSRIVDLAQRIATTEIPVRMEHGRSSDESGPDYRSKYRQREATLSATEVFETVLSLVQTRSVSSGPQVVMENREAFQAMLKLDLAGQKELIRLIATSNDPRLVNGDTLQKCEQINVCLCAMADRHPEAALGYLRKCGERIGKFYQDRLGIGSMISYAIRRLCEHDPSAGLNELLVESGKDGVSGNAYNSVEVLVSVAQHQPGLALETISRLPVDDRIEPLRRILEQTDSDEECTRRFQSLRAGLRSDPASVETAFSTLFRNVSKRNNSWRKSADWVEELDLSDEEKLRAVQGLRGLGEGGVDGHPEPTQWLADYLPPSKERSFILWLNVRQGIWGAMDPQAAEAFLRKNSIDEVEMKRLADEKFLNPY